MRKVVLVLALVFSGCASVKPDDIRLIAKHARSVADAAAGIAAVASDADPALREAAKIAEELADELEKQAE